MLKWLKCCYSADEEKENLIDQNIGLSLQKAIKKTSISMQTKFIPEENTLIFSIQNNYFNDFPKCVINEINNFATKRADYIQFNINADDIELCKMLIAFFDKAITPPEEIEKNRLEGTIIYRTDSFSEKKRSKEPQINSLWTYDFKNNIKLNS